MTLRRKLANHITLHFRSFLAKSNDSILRKSPKTLFLPQILRTRVFPEIGYLHRKFPNHNTLHFRAFLAKSNDSILSKSPKTLFLGLFGPLFPNFWKMRVFPEKLGSVTFELLWTPNLTSCKISKKSNEPILNNIQKS